jgi:lysyl-tRNA synthetase class I
MNFFKNLFGQKTEPARSLLPLKVRCRRCGEIIEARVDLSNELSVDYDEAGQATYHCRKGLIGQQRCYQTIEVELQFDTNRRLINRQINGGEFVDT